MVINTPWYGNQYGMIMVINMAWYGSQYGINNETRSNETHIEYEYEYIYIYIYIKKIMNLNTPPSPAPQLIKTGYTNKEQYGMLSLILDYDSFPEISLYMPYEIYNPALLNCYCMAAAALPL